METRHVQDLVETALEQAIESLDLIATDETLDRRLRETQALCNHALMELRGYGHDAVREEWKQKQEEEG